MKVGCKDVSRYMIANMSANYSMSRGGHKSAGMIS